MSDLETVAEWMMANGFATGHGDTLKDLLDELSGQIRDERARSGIDAEVKRLRGAITEIQHATLDGRVCDDIAWFSQIETLHDFCEATLNPQQLIETEIQNPLNDPEPDDPLQCEGCGKNICTGDAYTVTMDGCYLCQEDAPSYQDVVDYWNHHAPDDDDEREAKLDAEKAFADHIASGGKPNDKPLWIME